MAIMSVAYLLTPFSPNIYVYGVLRFMAGVGFGPEALVVLDILTTEFFPAKRRGRALSIGYTMSWTAPIVVAGLAVAVSPLTQPLPGWQWIFIVGGLGVFTLIPFRFIIPESPRWLEVKGRAAEAEKTIQKMEEIARKEKGELPEPVPLEVVKSAGIPFGTLFNREYRKRTIMLWIFEFFQAGIYYGFTSLAPVVLVSKGFTIASTLQMSLIIYVGYFVGSTISILIIDSVTFDRKWQVAFVVLLMGIDGVAFGYSTSIGLLIATGFLFGTLANIFSNAYHLYAAELYPTRIRSFADGAQYSLSRLGNFIWLSLLPLVLVQYGAPVMFSVVFAYSVLLLVDIGVFGPKASGVEVEKLSK
jgi:putative MFS transporter